MKKALAILTLPVALAGCAGTSPAFVGKTSDSATVMVSVGPAAPQQESGEQVSGSASLTGDDGAATSLTPEVLFKYLAAEIAAQREQPQAAYINMLAVAQQTRDPGIARRAAEIAMAAGHADAALAAVRLWQQTAPHSQEAMQTLVSLLAMNDLLDEARPLLQQQLQEAPAAARGALILHAQRLLARSKDKTAAFLLLEELVTDYKSLPEAHLALAQAAYVAGNTARAGLEARAALAANPRSELAALILAQVTPDKHEAAKELASFLQAHPAAREARLAYARMLVEQKQFQQAQNQFKLLLEEQPGDLTALYAIGLLSMQMRDYPQAEQYLTSFLETLANSGEEQRDPTQAYLMLAQIAEERSDIPAALQWLDQVAPTSEDVRLELQIRRAQLTAKGGRVDQAIRLLRQIKAEDEQGEIQLLAAQAQILKKANRPQQGLAVLQKGLKRFPDNTDLLYDYAMLAESMKKFDAMEKALRKIIRLTPDNQHAYNALGYSLADRKTRLPEAYRLIKKAFTLAPEDPFIMDSMGWVEFRLGRLEEAERLLRRAYELRPDPEIAVHLGEVLWKKGQQEAAKELWRDALRIDPKNGTLKNTLVRLQVEL